MGVTNQAGKWYRAGNGCSAEEKKRAGWAHMRILFYNTQQEYCKNIIKQSVTCLKNKFCYLQISLLIFMYPKMTFQSGEKFVFSSVI